MSANNDNSYPYTAERGFQPVCLDHAEQSCLLFLYVSGKSLENEKGDLRTFIVFITGGVLSFILSIPVYPGTQMVGASAAIFSVMAALLLVRRAQFSIRFMSPTGPLIIVFFLFNIIAIQNGDAGNVAYISHTIGFFIGLVFGASWNNRWKESLMYSLFLLAIYIVIYNYFGTRIGLL